MTNAEIPRHSLGEAIERLERRWATIVGFGVLLVILGVAALLFSLVATLATVTLNGVLFLIAGAAEIGLGMHIRGWNHFFLWLIGGVLYLALGVFCLVNPMLGSALQTFFVAAGLAAAGLARLNLALQIPSERPRLLVILSAVVSIFLGVTIVTRWPMDNLTVIGALLGIDLLFHGAGWVGLGMGMRLRA